MAAGNNSQLCILFAFLLFSFLTCLDCQWKSTFKDIYYRKQAGFWISADPTPDSLINFYFNVTFHFKRRPHGFTSDKLSLAISKTSILPYAWMFTVIPDPTRKIPRFIDMLLLRTEICIVLSRPLNLIIHGSNCWF